MIKEVCKLTGLGMITAGNILSIVVFYLAFVNDFRLVIFINHYGEAYLEALVVIPINILAIFYVWKKEAKL